ncbi:Steroidogenic acute regulatory protein, mitochondrial [Labeo rohita]|uniref:START domain-containing protein 1 n=1 Tax=Labeo rohita TaxID=84645 RepID=A0ABQ8M5R7_LABRO|nr:steroidogenic acute regulatory protein, mitochondrial [Labeo rohita]KAI2658234.1 Steroidogenic acute regulatory protein, mitochondrial [Labeo rohita]
MEALSSFLSFTVSIKASRGLLLFAISAGANMLPAVLKLCCGITYPHLRSMAGLQRAALVAFGQEIAHWQSRGQITLPAWSCLRWTEEAESEQRTSVLADEDVFYLRQGEKALNEALKIVESKDGWTLETAENGDVIYSKVLTGSRRVFRLEAELDASPEELQDILFFRVEEMHEWNPSIRRIKVLKHVGRDTMVTHEVSAETAGNLIGQRDFLSVRHSSKSGSRVYLGGAATRLESLPPQPEFVRAEDGPTCIILQPLQDRSDRSRFIWLLNMDVKGWLPQSLVNKALPRAQADFTKHLRRRLAAQKPENNRC